MELLHKLFFAFLSGFSEFVMVSGDAHQALYMRVTGIDKPDDLVVMAIHLGLLGALWLSCKKRVRELMYAHKLASSTRRRKTRTPDPSAIMDARIINTASIPAVIGLLLKNLLPADIANPGWISLFLLINCIVLYIPRLFGTGNKDSLSYTMFDGFLMGLLAVAGILPGISRLACLFCVGLLRGAERKYSLELSLLIMFPITIGLVAMDVYSVLLSGVALTGYGFLGCILGFLGSFAGSFLAMRLIRHFSDRINTASFACYSGGFAIFQFLVYILIP